MSETYKAAYERQKKARILAEDALEKKSRELYDSNQSLMSAYTKLKDQKMQLLHQEKLASIGELSAGIAHEINNPTGYVKSNLGALSGYVRSYKHAVTVFKRFINDHDFSQEKIQALSAEIAELDLEFIDDDVNMLLKDSQEGVARIQTIVENLKKFSRPDSKEVEDVCINTCIQDTLKLVESSMKYKVDIVLKLNDVPVVKGRIGELSQVVLNLLTNAADAIEKNGQIHITTEKRNALVVVLIKDTGQGIDPAYLGKIFDPFFSTKDVGSGTGLGLSISHGIIKSHHGTLSATSEKGEGTTFMIELPTAT